MNVNQNPVRRSPSPLPPHQQQPAQYIYATSPTTNASNPFPWNPPPPPMATTNGGDVTAGADGRPLYLCQPFIRAALVTGKFKTIVVLPKYADVNEWVAVNSQSCPYPPSQSFRPGLTGLFSALAPFFTPVFDFYTNLNLFLSVLSESCTQSSCPTMSAGPG